MLRLAIAALLMLGAEPFGADGSEKVVVLEPPAEDDSLATSVYSEDADWLMIPIRGRCMRVLVYPTRVEVFPLEAEPEPGEEDPEMALPSTGYATVTATNPSAALTDFTLMVDLSRMPASWWAAVDTADGTKGRAAKDTGAAELPCDWIAFDAVNETGWLRVKWTGTLASTGTQVLRIYPPVAANASVAATDPMGQYAAYDAGWGGYYPLDGDANDRTSNARHGTIEGSPTFGGVGKVGKGITFGPGGQAIDLGSAYSPGAGAITISLWVNQGSETSKLVICSRTDGAASGYDILANTNTLQGRCDNGPARATDNATGTGDGNYHHAVLVLTGAAMRFYVDGAQVGSDFPYTGAIDNTQNLYVARRGGIYFYGGVDDLHVHIGTARIAAWIDEEHAQTADQAAFWGTPAWVAGAGGGFNPAWAEGLNSQIGVAP